MSRPDFETWLTGIHAVASALEHDAAHVTEVLVVRDARNRRVRELAEKARAVGVAVHSRPPDALDPLAAGRPHQGIAARYRPPPALDEAQLLERAAAAGREALVLVLDEVQDPGNLGACLRSAAAAGVTAVVTPRHRAAPLTPVARKAAAGAAEIVPRAAVTNLRRTLDGLKEAGLWVAGAAGDAETPLWEADLSGPLALVLGGEEKGLRRLTAESCDLLFRIPMSAGVESLNVSVACGILLFETRRQREAAAGR